MSVLLHRYCSSLRVAERSGVVRLLVSGERKRRAARRRSPLIPRLSKPSSPSLFVFRGARTTVHQPWIPCYRAVAPDPVNASGRRGGNVGRRSVRAASVVGHLTGLNVRPPVSPPLGFSVRLEAVAAALEMESIRKWFYKPKASIFTRKHLMSDHTGPDRPVPWSVFPIVIVISRPITDFVESRVFSSSANVTVSSLTVSCNITIRHLIYT